MKVFISHSSKDSEKFDDVCYALKNDEIPYWDPDQMPAGTSLRKKLRIAIQECPVCVLIATQQSLKSGWCQAEIGAFWGAGKPVILYRADPNLTEDTLPEQFKGDKYATKMRDVVESVKFHLDETKHTSPADLRDSHVQLSLEDFTILVGPPMKLEGIDISTVTWKTDQCYINGPNIHENISPEKSRVGNSYIIRLPNPILKRILQSKVLVTLDLKDSEGKNWKTAPISLNENFVYLRLPK
jgi:hypothetical protein